MNSRVMGPTALTLQSINRGDRAGCPMLAKGNPDSKLAVDGPKELDGLILFTARESWEDGGLFG